MVSEVFKDPISPGWLQPDETGRKLTHDLRKTPHGAGVAAAASIISFEHRSLLTGTSVALVVGKAQARGESRVTLCATRVGAT
ncbi:MAG TPA: hypothetical protein VFS90_11360 [Pyrinomonadaceae bacterium]|nr:hypothetical protein [Pyrinomonadaceae bacterium]